MQGLYVHVTGQWPIEAFLQSWGRGAAGWYGLIVWEAHVRQHGTPERMTFAAWVPAERLRRPHYVPARAIPRVVLPANRLDWPAPSQSLDVDHHLGIWDTGDLPLMPEGVEIDDRPAWRRR